jgi:high-affinity Fe2+/Pb2+ permease
MHLLKSTRYQIDDVIKLVALCVIREHDMIFLFLKQENDDGKDKYKTITQSNRKGKYATSTENRRLMWEYIIWPLVLELDKNYFTPEEYHKMRNKVSIEKNIPISKMSGGLVSLLLKGILTQDQKYYSIHYKLIPYMRKKVHLDYETVLREVRSKK